MGTTAPAPVRWRKNSAGPDHIASGAYLEEGILHIVWPDGSRDAGGGYHHPAQQNSLTARWEGKRRGTPPLIASGVRPVWDMEYIKAAQRYPMYADAGALALYPGWN